MMETSAEHILSEYVQAYQRLYNRTPKDLRALDHEWVIVNGAQMRASDLDLLTRQLQREYAMQTAGTNAIKRFLGWLVQ